MKSPILFIATIILFSSLSYAQDTSTDQKDSNVIILSLQLKDISSGEVKDSFDLKVNKDTIEIGKSLLNIYLDYVTAQKKIDDEYNEKVKDIFGESIKAQ
jgi:hypothetical protein